MTTFIICLVLLVVAYFTYGKFIERILGVKDSSEVPSKTSYDGVDYIPMPRWKTFLIQLLNIAGVGPIFGAILGAAYGPVAFLWITGGGIFMGAVHDFISGYMSEEDNGASLPEIIGKYLGLSVKQVMRIFISVMMILVGVVFLVSPAEILQGMTGWSVNIWIWIIFIYYILATLLPINKIIGNIYPIFGAALIFMALALFGVLLVGGYHIPDLTTFANFQTEPSKLPIIPTLFITIACGAISGFHGTQSPMMARCLKNKREARGIFYGAMIAESIIALIWAAIAMAFFGGIGSSGMEGVRALNASLASHGNSAAWVVKTITDSTLGKLGAVLAILGVVAAPITSGDTAFRSTRLIIADILGLSQKKLLNRLYICIPLFVVAYLITRMDYDVLWRYFSWSNQTLATFTLWAATVYLYQKYHKGCRYIVSFIPALFMTFICSYFLFLSGQMCSLREPVALALAFVLTLLAPIFVFWHVRVAGGSTPQGEKS